MKRKKTHLLVLGGGPGGYTAAFYAADRGLEVTLVDDLPRLGGVCMNHGCIPSKALLQTTAYLEAMDKLKDRGIHFDKPRLNLRDLNEWKDQVVVKLGRGLESLAKSRSVKVVRGRGTFEDVNLLRVEQEEGQQYYEFEQAIIATGSRPALPGPMDIGNPRVLTSREALEVESVPERMLVVGGGYIGLELGTVYARLGSEVTVVEATAGLLPGVDRDLVRPLGKAMESIFNEVRLETSVEHLSTSGEQVEAAFSKDDSSDSGLFDRVLVAIGRQPNTAALGLEDAGVGTDGKGFIKVDEQGRTGNGQVWAIGDCCRNPMLAHKAAKEARVAVRSILGERASAADFRVPAIVFTDPAVAWAGLTEAEAAEQDIRFETASFSWKASGRALSHGRTDGLTKLVVDPESKRLLGVGVCGYGAAELIAEGTLALEMGASVRDLAELIHPHPTLSETYQEAAEQFYGTATHQVARKADQP